MVTCGILCVFIVLEINKIQIKSTMIVEDKDSKTFCIIDDFNKNFNAELDEICFYVTDIRYHNRKGQIL